MGTFARLHSSATTEQSLPPEVCASVIPSPVMTRSASETADAKPAYSITVRAPERSLDQLAGTVGRGFHRVEAIDRNELDARGACHIEECRLAAPYQAEFRVNGFAERAAYSVTAELAARRLRDRPRGAFASVGERYRVDGYSRVDVPQSGGDGFADGGRRHVSLEFIWRYDDFHACLPDGPFSAFRAALRAARVPSIFVSIVGK